MSPKKTKTAADTSWQGTVVTWEWIYAHHNATFGAWEQPHLLAERDNTAATTVCMSSH